MGRQQKKTPLRRGMSKESRMHRVGEYLFFTIPGQIVSAISVLSVIIGGWIAFDGWVAKAADLQMVELRLDKKILKDDRIRTQQQIWTLEDRYGRECSRAEKAVRDQCRELREQLRQYDEQLKPGEQKK